MRHRVVAAGAVHGEDDLQADDLEHEGEERLREAGAGAPRSSRAQAGRARYLSSAHSASSQNSTCASRPEREDEHELAVGREEAPGHGLTLAQKSARVVARTGDARIAPPSEPSSTPAAMSRRRRRCLALAVVNLDRKELS